MSVVPKFRLTPPKIDDVGEWVRWEAMSPALWRDAPEKVLCWRYGWSKPHMIAVGADNCMNVAGLFWWSESVKPSQREWLEQWYRRGQNVGASGCS